MAYLNEEFKSRTKLDRLKRMYQISKKITKLIVCNFSFIKLFN